MPEIAGQRPAAASLTRGNINENGYQLAGHTRNGRLIDLDLQRAVDSLTPALLIEPPFGEDKSAIAAEPQTLCEMYEMSFRTKEDHVEEVLNALLAKPNLASRLAELATEALRTSIYLAIDGELITDHWPGVFRRNSKRYDLPNGRLSDNAALIASINSRASAVVLRYRPLRRTCEARRSYRAY